MFGVTRFPALLTIFQKVCDAVAFAHSQPEPVIHRDLKPENIMVGNYGEVLVMDWGAAKILRFETVEPMNRPILIRRASPPRRTNWRATCLLPRRAASWERRVTWGRNKPAARRRARMSHRYLFPRRNSLRATHVGGANQTYARAGAGVREQLG